MTTDVLAKLVFEPRLVRQLRGFFYDAAMASKRSGWPQVSLMRILKNADQRSAMTAKKDERVQDTALAMREYEAEKLALQRPMLAYPTGN